MLHRTAAVLCLVLFVFAGFAAADDDFAGPEGAFGPGGSKATISGVRGAFFPAFSPDGKSLAFSMYGDIWVVPVEGGYARRVTLSQAYDTKPRWSPDGKRIAFASKRSGNYDIWVTAVVSGKPVRLTYDYAFDSISDWSRDGKTIYFHSNRDGRMNVWRIPSKGGLAEQVTVTGGRDMTVSPDGSRMVFAFGLSSLSRKQYRGSSNWDLFVIAKPGDVPKPVTTFNGNDLKPIFARDGRSLFYLSEKNGWFNLYRRDVSTGEEKALTTYRGDDVRMPHLSFDGTQVAYVWRDAMWRLDLTTGKAVQVSFTINADLKGPAVVTRTITDGAEQPSWSPDGLKIAFQLRGDIWVMPASGGKASQLTKGSAIDEWPVWSPDGASIAFFSNRAGSKDIWVMPSRGGEAKQLTRHKANEFFHDWSPDGRHIVFCSDRSGNKDIWLLEVATGKETQLTKAPQADDDPIFSPDGKWIAFDSGRTGSQNIYIMPATGGAARRMSSGRFDQIPTWSPDSKYIAYESNDNPRTPSSIWVMRADGSCRIQVANPGSCPRWAPRGRSIAYERQAGRSKQLYTAQAPSNIEPGLPLNFMALTEVDVLKERYQAFEEAWRLIKDSFYDPKMHGVDWKAVKKKYDPLAKSLRTDEELIGLINRMLGELKASHMGFWGPTPRVRHPVPPTGYLGMRVAKTATDSRRSLTITHITPGGPADKVWIRKGDHLFGIGRSRVGGSFNVAKALSGTVGKEVTLRVGPSGRYEESRSVKVEPVSWRTVRSLEYRHWVIGRQALVRKLGRGRVGYIHLRMMGERDLEQFKRAMAGGLSRAPALIIDVRNNGGGRIHGDLLDILTRRPFGQYHPRGGKRTKQPRLYYMGPVAVLINEKSFSDAEVFPHGFKALKRGKVIGVPTNGGVIGTGSATLINGFTLRLPRVGWYSLKGENLEGKGVQPDILVKETPEDRMKGRDPQLKKAVEVLLEELKPKKKPVEKVKDPTPATPKKNDSGKEDEEY